jgi:hypothetical protein
MRPARRSWIYPGRKKPRQERLLACMRFSPGEEGRVRAVGNLVGEFCPRWAGKQCMTMFRSASATRELT